MQWKSLDKNTQVWLELNLVSVVTWAWWYRRTIRHYQECALEKSLLQTYSKWQANGDWFGEGGLLSMYPTCWGVLRSCWYVQIGNSCQLLSVCTQGYGSAPHSAWCYTQPSNSLGPPGSPLILWGQEGASHSHSIAQVAACSYELLLCPNSNHLFLHIKGTWMRHDC